MIADEPTELNQTLIYAIVTAGPRELHASPNKRPDIIISRINTVPPTPPTTVTVIAADVSVFIYLVTLVVTAIF